MSRSYKKHCGSPYGTASNRMWKKQWHSAMRAKERDLFRLQMKFPEEDYFYPIPKEVDDLWHAPSDGGSHLMYSSFNHYFFMETHPNWHWGNLKIPTRKEAWKVWIKEMIGK